MASKQDMERRWLAGMEEKRQRGRKDATPMPPWDEMPWFDLPTMTKVAFTTGVSTSIAKSNPNRILLAICPPQGNTINVGPTSAINASFGIVLSTSQLPLILRQSTDGILCQCEWFGFSSTPAVTCTIIEVILRDIPR